MLIPLEQAICDQKNTLITGNYIEQGMVGVVTTNMLLDEMYALLGYDPGNRESLPPPLVKMYKEAQRIDDMEEHRIQQCSVFIETIFFKKDRAGFLPSIIIAFPKKPNEVEILHANELIKNLFKRTKVFSFPRFSTVYPLLLDGLGRAAALTLLTSLKKFEGVGQIGMPANIIFPIDPEATLTVDELKQIFVDVNFRRCLVKASLAVKMEQHDPYLNCVKLITKDIDTFFNTKLRYIRNEASLEFYKKFLKGALDGDKAQAAGAHVYPENAKVTDATVSRYHELFSAFFVDLYSKVSLKYFKNEQLNLIETTQFLQGIGLLIYHYIDFATEDDTAIKTKLFQLSHILSSIDWRRNNPMFLKNKWIFEKAPGKFTFTGTGRIGITLLLNILKVYIEFESPSIENGENLIWREIPPMKRRGRKKASPTV